MLEKELFPPIKKYYNDLGFKVYCEVPCANSPIDVVVVKDDFYIAIELKTGFNKKVFYQAYHNQHLVDQSYVCAPTKIRRSFIDKCRRFGVGILRVNNLEIEKVLESETSHKLLSGSPYKDRFKEIIAHMKEGDEAGVPTMKGSGIAQDCLKRIKIYLDNNPDAKWKEIYNNVENHYASQYSMSRSMSEWQGFYLDEYKKDV